VIVAAVRANPARPVCMDGRIEPGQSGLGERRQRRPAAPPRTKKADTRLSRVGPSDQ